MAQGVRTLEHERDAPGRHGEQGGGLRLAPHGGGHNGQAKPHQAAPLHIIAHQSSSLRLRGGLRGEWRGHWRHMKLPGSSPAPTA
jgi:hypothetical protein